jgi:hypothetical protein
MKNWFTPRTLLMAAGVIILALLVWRFSNIVAWAIFAVSFITFFLLRVFSKEFFNNFRVVQKLTEKI